MMLFIVLAVLAGVAIATQASMNAYLGVLLKDSLLGTAIAFASSCLFCVLAIALWTKALPSVSVIRAVPLYLWFGGGMLSAFGVGMLYFLIPKLGGGPLMAYALTGQLLMATVASHYGWFNFPVKPLDLPRIGGIIALVVALILLRK
ncbi:DMT family transporter [Lacimicrobium alkaliphilum]|uniref:DMT family transporter n=1 Tax=Lacimicrobium alkaliphilum TaxID=1526571 RepID=A0ABQ1R4T3_9ALTE|nr:DMT family transporter [Lacimicrobium alkaliphilum]GGD54924.1 hypothetical protein GCM10011357_08320 [Lacimicrobium alkaliphilum]